MTLRRRIALAAATAVAFAVVAATVGSYLVVRGELRRQIDADLDSGTQLITTAINEVGLNPPADSQPPGGRVRRLIPSNADDRVGYVQLINPDGSFNRTLQDDGKRLPIDDRTRAVASGSPGSDRYDADVRGERVRIATTHLADGGAVQIGRSLENSDAVLSRLRLILAALAIGGIALAAVAGRVIARTVIRPLEDLQSTVEHIGETEDLGRRIVDPGTDEVGRLAQRFNAMLDTLQASQLALAESSEAQRQLVADASHELRTPVTSLRMNIEVLLDTDELEPDDRRRLLADVLAQIEELSELVVDIIELARGDEPIAAVEQIELDRLVESCVARAARHAPGVDYLTTLRPCTVSGLPDRIGRAVNNLLDNAAKYGGDGVVEVALRDGVLTVTDHGPGVAPGDVPHLFDRFYRGATARDRHGSGLGLAIVRQVAELHGGRAEYEPAPGGGARFRLVLPVVPGSQSPLHEPAPAVLTENFTAG